MTHGDPNEEYASEVLNAAFDELINKKDWTDFQLGMFVGQFFGMFGLSVGLADGGKLSGEVINAISRKAESAAERFRSMEHYRKYWEGKP